MHHTILWWGPKSLPHVRDSPVLGAGTWADLSIEEGSSLASYILEPPWVVLYALSDACNCEKIKCRRWFMMAWKNLYLVRQRKETLRSLQAKPCSDACHPACKETSLGKSGLWCWDRMGCNLPKHSPVRADFCAAASQASRQGGHESMGRDAPGPPFLHFSIRG